MAGDDVSCCIPGCSACISGSMFPLLDVAVSLSGAGTKCCPSCAPGPGLLISNHGAAFCVSVVNDGTNGGLCSSKCSWIGGASVGVISDLLVPLVVPATFSDG